MLPDPRRLALVVCTVRAAGGEKQTVGTGYFLTDKLVLTASHVVPDNAAKIGVRVQESSDHWYRADTTAVWRDVPLDAVLIRAARPIEATEPVIWHEGWPTENGPWNSTAYPIASGQETDDHTEYKSAGLDGTFYAQGGAGQGERTLELSVNAEPENGRWGGISGAPIFVGNKLLGIIKSVPNSFTGTRLTGVPAELLWRNPAFRLALAPQWLDDFPSDLWVLVLLSDGDKTELETTVGGALRRGKKDLALAAGRPVSDEPIVVGITDALQSAERWLKVVRALCIAPIALIDVTDFQPAVMVLLGIRAVVKRGITLTSTANNLDGTELSRLPFNIQEGKLMCHRGTYQIGDPKHPLNMIAKAIRDGLRELRSHSGYLDLPVYEAVRCKLPDSPSGHSEVRDSILVLCSFHNEYQDHWIHLSNRLAMAYPEREVVRMRDISSPRLVGQALYEHIRWSTTCVIDWSHWRPNVLFEFGVRLACSELGSINLIEKSDADSAAGVGQKAKLIDLFQPVVYSRKGDARPLREAMDRHEKIKQQCPLPLPRTALPHDAIYRICIQEFDWSQEEITLRPHQLLQGSAEAQFGKDPQKRGEIPVLFSGNFQFKQALENSVQERWIAAWCYLRNRYATDDFRSNTNLRNELISLGENVLQWLTKSGEKRLETLRTEIFEMIDELEKSDPKSKNRIWRQYSRRSGNERPRRKTAGISSVIRPRLRSLTRPLN